MSVGVHCIVVGVLLLIAAAAAYWMKREERVSGFDAESIELLTMPAHERIAKDLAKLRGHPEFMWRRFTPLAVTIILNNERGSRNNVA